MDGWMDPTRFATKTMRCLLCTTEQPFGPTCSACEESMGRYFCGICKFVDNDPGKNIYHCPDCGICRIGKGLGVDMMHCAECGSCVAMNHKELGNCKKDLLTGRCPVCLETFFDSKGRVTLMPCKHPIHNDCLDQVCRLLIHNRCPGIPHTEHRYPSSIISLLSCNICGWTCGCCRQLAHHDFRCPLCSKSFADIQTYNSAVEEYLNQHTTEFLTTSKKSVISCSQCEKRFVDPRPFETYRTSSHIVVLQLSNSPAPSPPFQLEERPLTIHCITSAHTVAPITL